MANYLFIESRDPFDGETWCSELARTLAHGGAQVAVLLVGNGVLPARAGARAPALVQLRAAGVGVFADEFSLRERGIAADRLSPGVQAAPLDIVVDRLIDGSTVIWH